MARTAYCIFYPKQSLLDQLQFLEDPDSASLFDSPILWETYSQHRTTWTKEEKATGHKLLFMVSLYRMYIEPVKSFVEVLLGEPPFTPDTFDKWWSIRYSDGIDEVLDGVLQNITRADLDLIAAPDLPEAMDWVTDLKTWAD